MYLEKAKLEEFEIYYQMKCEKYIAYWSQGNYEIPPRENLYRFYTGCLQSAEGEQCKEIYLIKTDEGETAGYLYMDYLENSVDIPIALCERFTKKVLAKQAISEGLRMAREKGYRQSEVEIRADNAASIRLYTSCGYHRGKKTREIYSSALKQSVAMYAYQKKIEDAG